MNGIMDIAKNLREILLGFYSPGHRYIKAIDVVLDCPNVDSKEFGEAVGSMGWSGAGSLVDQVFCDLPYGKYKPEEITKANHELSSLMFTLGSHALEVDPKTPNHQAIKSMLDIWKNCI